VEYTSSYLPRYAQDDTTQRTFLAAKRACRENPDCFGITCVPDQDGLCTSRVGPNPKSSPAAEVSYVCSKYIHSVLILHHISAVRYSDFPPPKDRRFEQNSQTLASVLWEGSFKTFPRYRGFFPIENVFFISVVACLRNMRPRPSLTSLVRRFSVFRTVLSASPQCVCVCISLLGTPFGDALTFATSTFRIGTFD
jgi:hypothetical protein